MQWIEIAVFDSSVIPGALVVCSKRDIDLSDILFLELMMNATKNFQFVQINQDPNYDWKDTELEACLTIPYTTSS
jgi:hypothetical protein